MKVVCIKSMYKNGLKNGLKKGKAYEVIEIRMRNTNKFNDRYKIIDDGGWAAWYNRETVIPLEEWRSKQLNELGI